MVVEETVRLVLDLIVGRISGTGSGSGSGWVYDRTVPERDRGCDRPPRVESVVLRLSAALYSCAGRAAYLAGHSA